MKFRLYFIVSLIFGLLTYSLNWNSLSNIDQNCTQDILKISNKLLFTISIIILTLSFISIFKDEENDVSFYPIIFLILSLFFVVLSIINLINSKKNPKQTTTPENSVKPEEIECVSIIVSIINLLTGIILGMFSIYYLKNEILNFSSI